MNLPPLPKPKIAWPGEAYTPTEMRTYGKACADAALASPPPQSAPREAAEAHRQLMAIVDAFGSSYRDGLPTEGLRARISKGIRALSAPQEASKVEPVAWIHPLMLQHLREGTRDSTQVHAKQELSKELPLYLRPTQQALSDAAKDSYDKVDRFLRNNLDDTDYAEYSEALEAILAAAGGSEK